MLRRLGRSLGKRIWRNKDWRRATGEMNFNPAAYWLTVGKPIVDDALAHPGFWSEVLDPAYFNQNNSEMNDELVVLHALEKVLF